MIPTAWKAMIYDIGRKLAQPSLWEKATILPDIQHIQVLIVQMDKRIDIFTA